MPWLRLDPVSSVCIWARFVFFAQLVRIHHTAAHLPLTARVSHDHTTTLEFVGGPTSLSALSSLSLFSLRCCSVRMNVSTLCVCE